MRRFTVLTVALSSAVAFLVGVILAGGLTPAPTISSAPRTLTTRGGLRPARDAPGAVNFADVAEKINPSVVNIDAAAQMTTRPFSRCRVARRPWKSAAPAGRDGRSAARIRGSPPGIGQRVHHRSQGLHPHQLSRHRRGGSHYRHAGGRARAPR